MKSTVKKLSVSTDYSVGEKKVVKSDGSVKEKTTGNCAREIQSGRLIVILTGFLYVSQLPVPG